jgi:hypothetical protein
MILLKIHEKSVKKKIKIISNKSIYPKVVNSVSLGVLFFQLEWKVSVSECFGVPFRVFTIHIYIYITNIIQIQDKLIINYAIQTQCQTNIILKFKIFLNSQD